MTPIAVSLEAFSDPGFWIGVGLLATTYWIFTLGLQLNVGFSGILNFGQAGFMAVGAYAMGILVTQAGWSFWLALPAATLISALAGVLIALPALRLRADYFAIATLAFAEVIRSVIQNARGLTGGTQGLIGFDESWLSVSAWIQEGLRGIGLGSQFFLPLLLVSAVIAIASTLILKYLEHSPWGRVLRAIREDEDAARALGKNAFTYKLQSIAIASMLGAVSGYLLALNLAYLSPSAFDPLFTFIGYAILVIGGLAHYYGIAVGAIFMWTLLEAPRFLELPMSEQRVAAVRYIIVGVILIALMLLRPQGAFGKRQEMVLRND